MPRVYLKNGIQISFGTRGQYDRHGQPMHLHCPLFNWLMEMGASVGQPNPMWAEHNPTATFPNDETEEAEDEPPRI